MNTNWTNCNSHSGENDYSKNLKRFGKEVLQRAKKHRRTFFQHLDYSLMHKSILIANPEEELAENRKGVNILEFGCGDFSFATACTKRYANLHPFANTAHLLTKKNSFTMARSFSS